MADIKELQEALLKKDEEIRLLKQKVEEANAQLRVVTTANADVVSKLLETSSKLSNDDIMRYSRQLILPDLGVKGQIGLKNSSVLIIGAGGLGCPAAIYLAAAGIGRLGVVDYDEVELSNLHRQILHTESRVGLSKSLSIARSCHSLNSSVEYVPYQLQLDSSNALDIIKCYDIVLDATDNVATRYLLNDACVLAGKPLVSGSALRFEGQLTVYNYEGGPCYRCLYPRPPPPETVTNCSEGGVVGVVPGIIGSIQALEAIKIASGLGSSYKQRLLLFDALDGTFRTPKLRPRNTDCPVCGDKPSIQQLIDYEQFCGARASDKDKDLHVLEENCRISPKEYAEMLKGGEPHILLDVRPAVELDICRLPQPALNIPYSSFGKSGTTCPSDLSQAMEKYGEDEKVPIVCVCRRGNDSQLVVRELKEKLAGKNVTVMDIKRGLYGWQKQVDQSFPLY
ncbi:adenylyltransferase and sulfurtransferase MOCS3 [Aplysia californica]|uniref:Adenylyltransferase and sulfurtransferase MOCS3 homolog n=1 Tax=Aplysia californica TaxID=6500 RepID=A0ABM0JQ46_APLCA|nr:adenylyltransferase and sulfurtransferase MOCS3 [Aplysia californica]